MYLSFYNLEQKPFQISTDPAFLWLGKKHREALVVLKYGILDTKGFVLLTGDVGTGKTTLINSLLNDLGDEVVVARVPDPGMGAIDFMNYISHAFGMGRRYKHKNSFLIHFSEFLNSSYNRQKKVLLIIDECQRLSSELLEEVRQLSNIERQEIKLLNIFLIGQNEFNDVLIEPRNRAVRQRIAISYSLSPLDLHETGELIHHRLKVAGAARAIFSSEAIDEIYAFSRGLPRKINILCDHCLFRGFTKGVTEITAAIVQRCAGDFSLPVFYEQNDGRALWAQVKDEAGPVPTDTAAGKESATVADHEATRPPNRQKYGRSLVSVLMLLLIGYGFLLPENREAIKEFVGYGWQVVHAAYVRSFESLTGDEAEERGGVATAGLGEAASDLVSGANVAVLSDMPVSPVRTADEPVQFYEEADMATKNLIAGSVSPAFQKESSPAGELGAPSAPSAVEQTDDVSRIPVVDAMPVAGQKPLDGEEDANAIFRNMDRYLSENGAEKEATEEQNNDRQQTESVDSGKVIDWLLKKHKE